MGRPSTPKGRKLGSRSLLLFQWLGRFFLFICSAFLIFLGYYVLIAGNTLDLLSRIFVGLVNLYLGFILGRGVWRTVQSPDQPKDKPSINLSTYSGPDVEKRLIQTYGELTGDIFEEALFRIDPEQERLAHENPMRVCGVADDSELPEHAIVAWSQMIERVNRADPTISSGIYESILRQRLLRNDFPSFAEACNIYVSMPFPVAHKVWFLDEMACVALYHVTLTQYTEAEYCARKALELDPSNLSLQGTLGGAKLMRGQVEEAETHLRNCYENSPAVHDKAISGYYLALAAEKKGELSQARELAVHAKNLYLEDWFTVQVDELLKRLKVNSARC